MKTVHRVWLGSPPPAVHDYSEAWAATNPDYELVTWTDEKVEDDLARMVCQAEYDAAPTYVHRADIVLVEAVHRYGGVSVGYDMEPLKPIGPLIAGHAAWCTPDADGFPGQAFFGGEPGHPAWNRVLDVLPERIARDGWQAPHLSTGPYLWGEAFGRFGEQAADYGLAILGTYKTAYAERYWEKGKLSRSQLAARLRHSVVRHHFAGSWLGNPDSIQVRR